MKSFELHERGIGALSSRTGRRLVGTLLILLAVGCGPGEEEALHIRAAALSLHPETLLDEARLVIMEGFGNPLPERDGMIPAGISEVGLFVRLWTEEEERGCFTFYRGVDGPEPWLAVVARNAAFTDPRYPPLSPDKKDVILEVAVIGELTPMSGPDDFIPGFHTVFIRLDGRQAILQAPIAVQRNLDGNAFLTVLSLKAGLPPTAWSDPAAELLRAPTIWAQAPLHHQ